MSFKDWLAYVLLNRPAWTLYSEILAGDPIMVLAPGWVKYQVTTVGAIDKPRKRKCVLAITEQGIAVYPHQQHMSVDYSCLPGELRWFGRPVKYQHGTNEIVIHAQIADQWQTLQMWLGKYNMQKLIRAMKAIATPEQIKAYRRRRPYIHHGPLTVEPAHQTITGEWNLAKPVTLYLTPSHLTILEEARVLRAIPLELVQRIQALHRLDAPEANGLVRFQVEGENMAFATARHKALAEDLAEAAKRTLEEPVLQKRKSKDDDYFMDEEEWD